MGDGIANNDSVLTANINGVANLYVNGKNISDLSGIEGFTALLILECISNSINNLDVTQNTALTFLSCTSNSLTSLDVTNNTDLIYLNCSGNSISSLDISNNAALTNVSCASNQLACLNIKNGNNTNMYNFNAAQNQDLLCIEVDDTTHSTTNWVGASYYFDSQTSFSEDCNNPCSTVNMSTKELPTKVKELLYITDLLGRTTQPVPNQILLYKYSDGSVEKRMKLNR